MHHVADKELGFGLVGRRIGRQHPRARAHAHYAKEKDQPLLAEKNEIDVAQFQPFRLVVMFSVGHDLILLFQ